MDLRSKLYPVEPCQFIPEMTPEWRLARAGRITASSRIARAIGTNDVRNRLLDELEHELRTGEIKSFEGNWATNHGNNFEDQAIQEYDLARLDEGELVRKPGFTVSGISQILGASPDFLVGTDIVGQVKCPARTANHIALMYGNEGKYKTQVQCEGLVTGRSQIVFVTYDPRMPAAQQLAHYHVERDELMQESMANMVCELEELLFSGKRLPTRGKLSVERGVPLLF